MPDPHAALARRPRSAQPPNASDFAFDTVINYGCAEPGQTAPSDLRASIFDTYADLHRAACRAGDSGDAILLGRCQLPELPPG
jgi:hypothetical protein